MNDKSINSSVWSFKNKFRHILIWDYRIFCWMWANYSYYYSKLTHWGRATHICVGNLSIIGSDNGLSPDRRQAIIRTNAGILLIRPLGINFNEILIGIQTFSLEKIYLKMSSAKWRPFCIGLNVLIGTGGFISGWVMCYVGHVWMGIIRMGNFRWIPRWRYFSIWWWVLYW